MSLQLRQFCQVHEEDNPRNIHIARTKGAIYLGPSGNLQGGFKFIALNSGKKIVRRSWDVIPMPDLVIARVNALGSDHPQHMNFTDRHGRLIGNVEIPGVDDQEEDDDHLPGVVPEFADDIDITGVDVEGTETQDSVPSPQVEIDDLEIHHADPAPIEVAPTQEETRTETSVPVALPAQAPELRRSTRVGSQTNQGYIPSLSGSKYSYAAMQLESQGVLNPDLHMFVQEGFYQAEPDVVAAIMTQLSPKAGLKEWGEEAFMTAQSEMKQLHLRNTFKPKHWRELSQVQRQTVLGSHVFLKQKRDGKIKGRTVAGGNNQRDYISKEDDISPTVATESVSLSCIIDAEEERDVAVVDIPNAFVQTLVENEKDMEFIKIRGILVDILVEIAPDVYKSYVSKDKKESKQLLVQCQNALYSTMVASLLYYRKFLKSLTDIDCVINPYDPCVVNKMIGGDQMTICFHVDDFKLSHRKTKVMDSMIEYLRHEYESFFEDGSGAMTVSRGKIHTYLCMTLDYTVRGQVKITMFNYVDKILTAFEKAEPKGGGTKTSAAPGSILKVDQNCEKLKQDKAVEFHNLVAKTLYFTKRARPDTCAAIAFLTTRVRAPDKDDLNKLVHLMRYIRGTRTMPLILSANGRGILKWWVDA
jgi:hypothetical protein